MRLPIVLLTGILQMLLLSPCAGIIAQQTHFNVEEWHQKLSSENDDNNNGLSRLIGMQNGEDSNTVTSMLNQLNARLQGSNLYYQARVYCFAASAKYNYKNFKTLGEIAAVAENAVAKAYETNDKRLIAFIIWTCGSVMINSQQLELAVTYKLKADEIYTEIGYPDSYDYIANWAVIGEALFHTGDYDQSIFYTRKALNTWKDTSDEANRLRVRYYNTIAQDYEQMDKLDSALIYLDQSLNLAQQGNQLEWVAINSGFKGEIFFKQNEYRKAKPLLQYDYAFNKNELTDIAAKSLQWIARINLSDGQNDSALMKAKESLVLLGKAKHKYYLQPSRILAMCYFTLAQTYEAVGKTDSFFHYTHLYTQLHDSIQKVAFLSSKRIVQMKLDNESILATIHLLEKEKRDEVIKRNLIIAAIVLLSIIVILYVKHSRLKQRHREQMVIQEKKIAETELVSAKQQIQQFTENVIEKSELIEKLQYKVAAREVNGDNQHVLEDLTSHTILTENDWENFKKLFEKVYPNFFMSLKEKAPNITVAEQRMGALIKLNLNVRQMASILGISVDSVHKAKQRLRQRLHVQNEVVLEETLAGM
jgi:tetratricopeptide (TPR) repeat protein